MSGCRNKQVAVWLACALLLSACSPRLCGAAEGSAPAAEAGETLLSAAEVDRALAELPVFKNQGCIKARIVTEVDDLLGLRKQEGELLLDRPNRVLRKFTRPSLNFWLLDGARLQEYAPANNKLYEKDFTKAPHKLKLIQAAFTGDLKALRGLFNIWVFKRPGAGPDKPSEYRFVLRQEAGAGNPRDFKKLQLRVAENGFFFHEIEMLPENGDRTVERYFDIAVVPRPSEKEFSDALGLPADVVRKLIPVEGDAKKK